MKITTIKINSIYRAKFYEIIKDAPTSLKAENIQKDNNNEDNESAN